MVQPYSRLRARPRVGVLTALVLQLFILRATEAQLSLIQQNSAVNPFQGQGTTPEGVGKEVAVQVILSRLLQVDDNSYSFKVNFWWVMTWKDERTAEQILTNTVSDPNYVCNAWCSTEQGIDTELSEELMQDSSNQQYQAWCCDNVYVPGAIAQNVISYDVSSLPVQYQLSLVDNTTVNYRVQVQGDFYTNYNFKSYPFDKHQLTINLQTLFIPFTTDAGTGNAAEFYIVYAENFGAGLDRDRRTAPLSVDVYNSAQLSQGQAWQIDKLELHVTEDVYSLTGTKRNPALIKAQGYHLNKNGVRFVIHISRTSKGFYALMIIIPISLIVVFSFVIFVLPVTQIKGRLNIMATLFLTLIVLQFVLESIMPTAYTLIPPYYLLLVSYIYIFFMVGLAVLTNGLAMQWQRRSARVGRTEAKQKFRKWIDELPPPPPGSNLKFGQLPAFHEHHNPFTGRHALTRMLTRRFNSKGSSSQRRDGTHEPIDLATITGHIVCDPIAEENEKPVIDSASEDGDLRSANGDAEQYPQNVRSGQEARMKKLASRPWTLKERSSLMAFLLRSKRVRWWSMWYYFIGRPESKEYCEFCAMKIEKWCLPILLLSYIAVVAIIFGVAQASTTSNRSSSVG